MSGARQPSEFRSQTWRSVPLFLPSFPTSSLPLLYNASMKAHILPVLLLLASWPLSRSLSFAQEQTAAAPTAEPHHRLLLENDAVLVFALTLKPTEQAYARYDHNLLMVALEDCA